MEARITVITLGVTDLTRAGRFYRDGLGLPTINQEGGWIAFINTTATRLALYPFKELATAASPAVQPARTGLAGSPWDPSHQGGSGHGARAGEIAWRVNDTKHQN
jgi:catechol 2,3-dioxygenase-like lactoylglutathione lyase family enzyme